MKLPIYLDNHATTPCDPKVFEAMRPYFCEIFGNSHSRSHRFGWQAEEAVETARAEVADFVGARPREIVFTSGATESDNLAIKGIAAGFGRGHIITVVTEHKAVLDSAARLEKDGFEVTRLPVAPDGLVSPDDVKRAISGNTILVSVMLANNEIGVIQPVAELGRLCKEKGIIFHTDATQAVGRIPVDFNALEVDLASISAHKMYGPKGVGALFVRGGNAGKAKAVPQPMMDGGGQERGIRSGTLNVSGVVGLGAACRVAKEILAHESERILSLRERLRMALESRLPDVRVNGSLSQRVPGNLNMSFAGLDGESLISSLGDIALSSGAACSSAAVVASYVLTALGVEPNVAHSTLRFGLGRFNTEEEIDYTIGRVCEVVEGLREVSRTAAWTR